MIMPSASVCPARSSITEVMQGPARRSGSGGWWPDPIPCTLKCRPEGEPEDVAVAGEAVTEPVGQGQALLA